MRATSQVKFNRSEKYKPYPAYKDSGVKWLGDIPEHWDLIRLLHTIKGCQGGVWGDEPAGDTEDLICIRVADFERTKSRVVLKEPTYRSVRPYQQKKLILKNGDLLLEKSGGGEQQPVGAVVLYDLKVRAVCSNFIARLEIKDDRHNPAYLSYLHKCLYESGVNKRSIKQNTGIQNLDLKSYFSEIVGVPNIEDQTVIAKFLDHETAKIGALITKQKQLIELLLEKRTALITDAVTKGLDPDVPMKDSGVKWSGEIPAHWEIKKITWIYSFGSGTTPQTDKTDYYEGGIPWVTTGELRENVIQSTVKYISDRALEDYSALRIYPAGSLLIAMYGATIGRMGMLGLPATVNQACCVLYQPIEVCSRYTFFWLLSYRPILVSWASGGGQPNLSQDVLRTVQIPLPPMSEQEIIITHIEKEIKIIDDLVVGINKSIHLLEEYRAALISAAVTGKIDVREEVPCHDCGSP